MKTRKIIALLLAICLIAACLPLSASAVESGTVGGLSYTFDSSSGTLTVSGSGPMPDFLSEGVIIQSIGWKDYANDLTKQIKHVVINEGVTSVGVYAFGLCTNMETISLPDSITRISDRAFEFCQSLTSLTLPKNLKSIGKNSFIGCDKISSIMFHDGITTIDDEAFIYLTGLKSLTLPKTLKSIGKKAFYKCEGLTSLTIPDSVTEIGDGAFGWCTNLTSVKLPKNLTAIPAEMLYVCEKLTSVKIPSGVKTIGDDAFWGCQKLKTVSLPAGLTYIGAHAFAWNDSLKEITLPSTVTSMGEYVFSYVTKADETTTEYANVKEMTICGKKGSFAESYAKENKFTFKAVNEEPVETSFKDVKPNDYFAPAVAWAVENGITSGLSETKFGPNAPCDRAQAVTFLWRAAGKPEPTSTENPFKDVKSSDYYYKAVLWAAENNITAGTSPTQFSPTKTCNRAQIVTFQYRAAGKPAVTGGDTFSDVSSGEYYNNAVKWAVENKITSGTGNGKFSPDDKCVRGQIVSFLYRNRDK